MHTLYSYLSGDKAAVPIYWLRSQHRAAVQRLLIATTSARRNLSPYTNVLRAIGHSRTLSTAAMQGQPPTMALPQALSRLGEAIGHVATMLELAAQADAKSLMRDIVAQARNELMQGFTKAAGVDQDMADGIISASFLIDLTTFASEGSAPRLTQAQSADVAQLIAVQVPLPTGDHLNADQLMLLCVHARLCELTTSELLKPAVTGASATGATLESRAADLRRVAGKLTACVLAGVRDVRDGIVEWLSSPWLDAAIIGHDAEELGRLLSTVTAHDMPRIGFTEWPKPSTSTVDIDILGEWHHRLPHGADVTIDVSADELGNPLIRELAGPVRLETADIVGWMNAAWAVQNALERAWVVLEDTTGTMIGDVKSLGITPTAADPTLGRTELISPTVSEAEALPIHDGHYSRVAYWHGATRTLGLIGLNAWRVHTLRATRNEIISRTQNAIPLTIRGPAPVAVVTYPQVLPLFAPWDAMAEQRISKDFESLARSWRMTTESLGRSLREQSLAITTPLVGAAAGARVLDSGAIGPRALAEALRFVGVLAITHVQANKRTVLAKIMPFSGHWYHSFGDFDAVTRSPMTLTTYDVNGAAYELALYPFSHVPQSCSVHNMREAIESVDQQMQSNERPVKRWRSAAPMAASPIVIEAWTLSDTNVWDIVLVQAAQAEAAQLTLQSLKGHMPDYTAPINAIWAHDDAAVTATNLPAVGLDIGERW